MKNVPRNLLLLSCDVLQQLPRLITTPFSSGVRTVCAVLRCTPGTAIVWGFLQAWFESPPQRILDAACPMFEKKLGFFPLGFSLKVVCFCICHFFFCDSPLWRSRVGRTDGRTLAASYRVYRVVTHDLHHGATDCTIARPVRAL
jgi:hypothetical protein